MAKQIPERFSPGFHELTNGMLQWRVSKRFSSVDVALHDSMIQHLLGDFNDLKITIDDHGEVGGEVDYQSNEQQYQDENQSSSALVIFVFVN